MKSDEVTEVYWRLLNSPVESRGRVYWSKLTASEIRKSKNHLLALAPYDSTSNDLSKLLIHIPWRMSREKDQNLFSFFIAFLKNFGTTLSGRSPGPYTPLGLIII